MFKNIITLVQAWLLSQGKCVGCGNPLKKPEPRSGTGAKSKMKILITCKCGRIFVYDREIKKYRRARLDEV